MCFDVLIMKRLDVLIMGKVSPIILDVGILPEVVIYILVETKETQVASFNRNPLTTSFVSLC